MPSELKKRLRKVIEYSCNKDGFSKEAKKEIYDEIPLKLRCEIAMIMHEGIIKKISFF